MAKLNYHKLEDEKIKARRICRKVIIQESTKNSKRNKGVSIGQTGQLNCKYYSPINELEQTIASSDRRADMSRKQGRVKISIVLTNKWVKALLKCT
jgi:hypothetical protein